MTGDLHLQLGYIDFKKPLSLIPQHPNMPRILAGKMRDTTVKCGKYQPFPNREAKQKSIRHLFMTVQPFGKGTCQRSPVMRQRIEMIARQASLIFQKDGGLRHTHLSRRWARRVTEKSCLCKWTQPPPQPRSSKPFCHWLVVDMILIHQSYECVYIQQVLRRVSQGRPPKIP